MKENNDEKRKALDAAMSQIEKQFGKGSVMKLGEYKAMEVEAIPTGALTLDVALGIGGIPKGRIITLIMKTQFYKYPLFRFQKQSSVHIIGLSTDFKYIFLKTI